MSWLILVYCSALSFLYSSSVHLHGREFLTHLFGALSLEVPDPKYFTQDINKYHLDWYDTAEAQKEFEFQSHCFDDYLKAIKKTFRVYKVPIVLARGFILRKLVKMSPYR